MIIIIRDACFTRKKYFLILKQSLVFRYKITNAVERHSMPFNGICNLVTKNESCPNEVKLPVEKLNGNKCENIRLNLQFEW